MNIVLKSILKNQRGAAAMEYAMIASLISVACIGGMQLLGISINDVWTVGSNSIVAYLRG